MKKIALFGGTFDPPHIGHVQTVLTVLEKQLVDEVWIVVTRRNPLKPEPLFDLERRTAMVQAAFSSVPQTRIVHEENEYTIDTVRALKDEYPELKVSKLFFVIGSDAFQKRKSWKEWDAVVREGSFLVMNRWGDEQKEAKEEEGLDVSLVSMSRFDISSSDIRKRFIEGKYISHLVHPTVETIMKDSI